MSAPHVRTIALGLLLLALGVAALASTRLPRLADDRERIALAALGRWPADARCGAPWGEWSALINDVVPEPHTACFAELATSPLRRSLLARIAREGGRSTRTRALAFGALVGREGAPEELALELLLAPGTPPALRLAVLRAAAAGPAGLRWAEIAADLPHPGLAEEGQLLLLAAGEPGMDGAVPALRAAVERASLVEALSERYGVTEADLRSPLRRARLAIGDAGRVDAHPCTEDCLDALVAFAHARHRAEGGDDAGPQPPLPVADGRVELAASEGEAADTLRGAVARLGAWISLAPASERPRRLRAMVLHPQALGEVEGADRVLSALRSGGGAPGATALLATELGALTGVPVEARLGADAVYIGVDGAWRRVGSCGSSAVVPSSVPEGTALTAEDAVALAVLEGVGVALRGGDALLAGARADALPDLPGPWAEARFVAWAAGGGGTERGDGAGSSLSRTTRAPWSLVPPPAPPAAPRGGRGRTRVPRAAPPGPDPVALPSATPPEPPAGGPDPVDAGRPSPSALVPSADVHLLAAWWAARFGHAPVARAQLAATAVDGLSDGLRARARELAAWLGEPGAGAVDTRAVAPTAPPSPGAPWAGDAACGTVFGLAPAADDRLAPPRSPAP